MFWLRNILSVCMVLTVLLCSTSAVVADDVAQSEEASNPLMDLLFPEKANPDDIPLQPKLPWFLFTFIFFLTFVLFMKSSTWNPLIKALDAREARIKQAERDADLTKHETKRLQAETEEKLANVKEQVKLLIAEARSKAETEKQEIISKAQADAQRVKDEALAEIREARESALEELSRSVEEQVAIATEHVVGRRL